MGLNKSILKAALFVLTVFFSNTAHAQFSKDLYKSQEVSQYGLTEIRFVGTGDIQLYMQQKENVSASTGLGVLFWRIWPNIEYDSDNTNNTTGLELQLEVKVDVASTSDTIIAVYQNNIVTNIRSFGSYIFAPLSSGQATTINSLWYFKPKEYNALTGVTKRGKIISSKREVKLLGVKFTKPEIKLPIDGIEINAAAANQVWKTDSVSSINVSVIAWRAGVFHEFLADPLRREKGYSIRLGVNYVGRSIQGDVGRSEATRMLLLLNDETTYHGGEVAVSIRLQNIRAEAALPIMHIGSKSSVPGLSGAQFTTTISFVGGFPLAIDKK
jgi:hypothetical protein